MATKFEIPKDLSKDRLINCVLGKDSSIPRNRALTFLIGSDLDDKSKILSTIINDENEITRIRHQAVLGYYSIRGKNLENDFLKSLNSIKNLSIKTIMIQLLGRIGSLKSYDILLKILPLSEGYVKSQIEFAIDLISYRYNQTERKLPYPDESQFLQVNEKSTQRKMKISPLKKEEIIIIESDLKKESFGIEISINSMLKIN